eukprot:scaffold22823_cov19-Prasinocladus_malaysianus.AAC.1
MAARLRQHKRNPPQGIKRDIDRNLFSWDDQGNALTTVTVAHSSNTAIRLERYYVLHAMQRTRGCCKKCLGHPFKSLSQPQKMKDTLINKIEQVPYNRVHHKIIRMFDDDLLCDIQQFAEERSYWEQSRIERQHPLSLRCSGESSVTITHSKSEKDGRRRRCNTLGDCCVVYWHAVEHMLADVLPGRYIWQRHLSALPEKPEGLHGR